MFLTEGRQVVENDDTVDAYNMNDNIVQQIHYGQRHKNSVEDHANYDFDDVQQFGDLVNPTTKDIAPQVKSRNIQTDYLAPYL